MKLCNVCRIGLVGKRQDEGMLLGAPGGGGGGIISLLAFRRIMLGSSWTKELQILSISAN